MMARALIAQGHRHIVLIAGNLSINTFGERTRGFVDGLSEARLTLPAESILTGEYTEYSGFMTMEQILDTTPEMSAVCVLNNAMAAGAYNCLRKRGIAVPGRIAVVSFGDIYNDQLFYVKPSFVSQHPQSIGSAAAELLLSRIDDSSLKPRKKIIPVKLKPGESV
jgi:DNA-binding LacI/PurR family transcriptional regulator